jgi:glycosyltransferase involved in cell wall biosynthesis
MNRYRIAYITLADANDRTTWSGTNFYMLQSIRKHLGETKALGPLDGGWRKRVASIANFFLLRFTGKRINYRDSFFLATAYSKKIDQLLKEDTYDLIIAPAGTATLAALHNSIPSIYINDRSIPSGLNYHPILTNLTKHSKKASFLCEAKAIWRSLLTVYSSPWASEAAKAHYSDYSQKICCIPFGANEEVPPVFNHDKGVSKTSIQLLFIGVKWMEKGGDIAHETLLKLQEAGIAAQLHIVGVTPPQEILDNPNVISHGYLNKNVTEEFDKLKNLFLTSDFFILPTRFEAYGLVFCEAASYGLPAIATHTGGIPGIIQHKKTGILISYDQRGDAYAAEIMDLIKKPELYLEMRRAARKHYEETLNWDAFGLSLRKKVDDYFSSKSNL